MTFPFLQLLFNSLIIGSVYALVASGFSLIYATNRFMHFAHGVSVVTAGYALFTFFNLLSLPFAAACALTLLASALIGFLMHRLVYRPLMARKSSAVILLVASIGLLILFENLILVLFGEKVKTVGLLGVAEGISVWGASITPLQIVLILTSVAVFLLLYLLMNKTRTGRNLRAVADNRELASVTGLDVSRLMATAFVLASLLAGMAGILISLEQSLSHTMGTNLMIKGFSGAVVGGMTSVPGAILGSYVVGLAENFGVWFLPSGYKDAIAFVLLFLFLLLKPSGLFGVDRGVKR